MKICVFGVGYVGLVTAVGLANIGHDVIGVDIDEQKIELLNNGASPIYEIGLEDCLNQQLKANRLSFTTDVKTAIESTDLYMIAVGTPQSDTGEADLTAVLSVAKTIAQYSVHDFTVITKSTVPVGTGDRLKLFIQTELNNNYKFNITSNPEFLREGCALEDFLKPARIIIGADNSDGFKILKQLYQAFINIPIIEMDIRSAELTKYASNAMLATKISFINQMSQLAESMGADIEKVRQGMGTDPRIGPHFIAPGCGYGGSCFPKDIEALQAMGREFAVDTPLINAVSIINHHQQQWLFNKIKKIFNNNLQNKTIALWGLAFKPNTDDMRAAPSHPLMKALFKSGASIQAYDPAAMETAKKTYGDEKLLKLCPSPWVAIENADVLIIATEWDEFKNIDLKFLQNKLKNKIIIDGRNLFNPETMHAMGFDYISVGRPNSIKQFEEAI